MSVRAMQYAAPALVGAIVLVVWHVLVTVYDVPSYLVGS